MKCPSICNRPTVLIIVITDDHVEPRCFQSILNQDYVDFACIVHYLRPVQELNKHANVVRNLNAIREMALLTEYKHFFFVDSDIILPSNALSSLLSHRKDVIGRWYRMK